MGYSRKEEIAKLRRERKEAKAAKKRKENVREKLVRFLIVCEGTKTEPHYFEALRSAWTNEAFELWYYLHFEYLDTGISREAYIDKLQNAFRKKMGDDNFKYCKGNPDIYRLLQQYGREELAKRFAQQLRALYTGIDYATHKPYTMVDILVEELEHPDLILKSKNETKSLT